MYFKNQIPLLMDMDGSSGSFEACASPATFPPGTMAEGEKMCLAGAGERSNVHLPRYLHNSGNQILHRARVRLSGTGMLMYVVSH